MSKRNAASDTREGSASSVLARFVVILMKVTEAALILSGSYMGFEVIWKIDEDPIQLPQDVLQTVMMMAIFLCVLAIYVHIFRQEHKVW